MDSSILTKKVVIGVVAIIVVFSASFYHSYMRPFMSASVDRFEVDACNPRRLSGSLPPTYSFTTERMVRLKCPAKAGESQFYECLAEPVELGRSACWVSYTSFDCLKPSRMLGLVVSGEIPPNSRIRADLNGQSLGYLTQNVDGTWGVEFKEREFTWRRSSKSEGKNCYHSSSYDGNKLTLINELFNKVIIDTVYVRMSLETTYTCVNDICYPNKF